MSEHTAIGKIDPAGAPAAPGAAPNFTAGEALIQPSLNRISLHGRVVQVEPKVMQVLVLMAQRPGTVIPRETFLGTVWAGTLADDYLLNRAVSELRKAFDDDPQAPRYIETIRKGGYRLIAPIAPARVAEAVARAAHGDATVEPPASGPGIGTRAAGTTPSSPAVPGPFRRTPVRWGLGAAALAVAAATVFVLAPRPPGAGAGIAGGYEVRPLTSLVGREFEPALSPDGSRVAFIWDGGDGGDFDVYVKTVGSEDLLALTRGAADERYPVWSPDGRALLFARHDGTGTAILRVSALGGAATRVLVDPAAADLRGMSLSPDGTRLAYAARERAGAPYRIVLAALDGGERRIVTDPPPGTLGDIDPRFARDGASLVFVRGLDEVTKDLYRSTLDGGEPARLTFDNRKINGLAWSPDGARLLFTSTRSGMYALWSADPGGGDLRPVALGNEDVQQPATAAGVDAIAFEQWMHRSRLRQVDLAHPADAGAGAQLQSTRWDSNPAWSPDGTRIAFASNRSGPHGIWVGQRDGHGAVQIADFGGAFIDHPAWSPDGRRIAFDASPQGRTAIYTVSPEGGAVQRVTDGPGDSRNPAWSRDGAWLYFESNRDGQWRIHAQPADGGEPVAIAAGSHPRESPDGRHLLYSKPDARGLWQRPRQDWRGGAGAAAETLLLADLEPQDGGNWAAADAGIYFVRRPAEGAPRLARFDPASAATTDLLALPPGFEGWGFDLSPDQTRLVFSELMLRESDLRLAVPR